MRLGGGSRGLGEALDFMKQVLELAVEFVLLCLDLLSEPKAVCDPAGRQQFHHFDGGMVERVVLGLDLDHRLVDALELLPALGGERLFDRPLGQSDAALDLFVDLPGQRLEMLDGGDEMLARGVKPAFLCTSIRPFPWIAKVSATSASSLGVGWTTY